MDKIDRLPWYDNYILLLEGKKYAEASIEDLENPVKQLQRVKKFFNNLGADYTKNTILTQAEAKISLSNKGDDSRLSQLKREVKVGIVIENAVRLQDDDSIKEMLIYKDDKRYEQLIKQLMFYIGISRIKVDPLHKRNGSNKTSLEEAYDAILKKYPPNGPSELFRSEGVNYYIYYFQCLRDCIKQNMDKPIFVELCGKVQDRCYNARLMLNNFTHDIYIADGVERILSEVSDLDEIVKSF